MRTVLIIGIGAGDPEYMTVQAIKALNRVDVFFVIDKGPRKDELARLRTAICDRYIEHRSYRFVEIQDPERDRSGNHYRAAVEAWRQERMEKYESALLSELDPDATGGFLVWGDPTIYDGTLGMIHEIAARGAVELNYEVIPGISSVQALAAQHKIPLNRVGEPIHITTGRRVSKGLTPDQDNLVVMLDGDRAFRQLSDEGFDIYWGAYVGTEDQILVSGHLEDVKDELETVRADAREKHGWIMDTYILRRRES
jgi:precorrin-6A synthase